MSNQDVGHICNDVFIEKKIKIKILLFKFLDFRPFIKTWEVELA